MQQWLADDNIRLIGIEGIGGTGKSMLAAKIYEEIEEFPKRFWADVSSGATIFSDLARRVLTDFGFPVPDDELQLVNALVQCLRSGQYLLIIDNLETLLDSERKWKSQFYKEFFLTWIEHGKGSNIIVTTRERPDLRGFEWLPLKGLKIEEGVSLLRESGIQGELSAFVELVDGHPLLLRLVADLIKDLYTQDPSLERLADLGLGNLRELLTDSQVVGVHRCKEDVGMILVLDASFERLADWQKIWLQNLSVFRIAFDAEAAVAMFPQSDELPVERGEVEQKLRRLLKRSFLEEQLNPQRQFSFQPLVLEYLRYKAGEQTEAHWQAINYYYQARTKEKSSWQTIGDLKEYLEIFYHLYQLGEYDHAFDTIQTCNDFLTLRGYYTVKVDLYEKLVEAWQQNDTREHGKYTASLTSLGNAYDFLGLYPKAVELHLQSLELACAIGDQKEKATSYNNLGNVFNSLGKYKKAIQYQQKALTIAREIKDLHCEGSCLGNLGLSFDFLGNCKKAIDHHQQSLVIFRKLGDHHQEVKCLCNLGLCYNNLGQYQSAINYKHKALDLAKKIGYISGQVMRWAV
ncbi:MAG: tetratricopeptide repeat protein [Xenococcus sp. (in: cyanobacteria)]